jgi:hypothetical protein
VRVYGLVDARLEGDLLGAVVELSVSREVAEQALADVLSDEPELSSICYLEEIELVS